MSDERKEIEHLSRKIKSDANNATLYYNRGIVYYALKDRLR